MNLFAHVAQTLCEQKFHLRVHIFHSGLYRKFAAVRKLAGQVEAGTLTPAAIDERRIAAALDTAALPDPDLIIRTSGECRLSNFLLWQASYAELYFPQVLWPDFTEEEFDRAMEEYARRDRRFGLVK